MKKYCYILFLLIISSLIVSSSAFAMVMVPSHEGLPRGIGGVDGIHPKMDVRASLDNRNEDFDFFMEVGSTDGCVNMQSDNVLNVSDENPMAGSDHNSEPGYFLNSGMRNDGSLPADQTPVPEPATLILVGVGFVAVAGLGRRVNQNRV